MDNGCILILEEDDDVRQFFIQKVLEPLNFRILSAQNQKQGLEQALLQHPDLILLGDTSKGLPNQKFLSVLSQSSCNSPVVLLTATASQDDIIEAFRLGIRDFIHLPARFDDAKEIINRVIDEGNVKNQREEVNNRLLMTDGVQITMTTLSHYMNNYLTALDGTLTLLSESVQGDKLYSPLADIVKQSQTNLNCIKMVMQILVSTTSVTFTKYDDSVQMIDIHDEMMHELQRIEKKTAAKGQ